MKQQQKGQSFLGLIIVLAIASYAMYSYMQNDPPIEKGSIQAPKNQKQLNALKDKLDQNTQNSQSKKDEAWQDL